MSATLNEEAVRRRAARWAAPLVLALAAVAVATPADAQQTLTGRTAGGAWYRIDVPEPWNGQLVIWNHGYDLSDPEPEPDLGPLAALQRSEGFAVAASTYRDGGWATFKVVKDLRALVAAFRSQVGDPTAVYLTGGSFGGLVSVQAAETGGVGNVAGVLALCAPLAGSRNWDGALDLRLTYDAVCAEEPAAAIPGGATGLPAGDEPSAEELVAAIDACTGVSRPRAARTAAQRRRLARLLELTRIDESFLLLNMEFATRGLSDLIHDRRKLRGRQGVGNQGVRYRDPELDADIERVRARRGVARRLARFYTPNGRLGSTPVLALHTDGDDLVVVENLSSYAEVASPEMLVNAVAVERVPTHCGFTPAEIVAGWETLVVWGNNGSRPTVESLQSNCTAFAGLLGLEATCRFDASYEIGNLDDRIAPRD
jgi:hypothetical protein